MEVVLIMLVVNGYLLGKIMMSICLQSDVICSGKQNTGIRRTSRFCIIYVQVSIGIREMDKVTKLLSFSFRRAV